MLCCISSNSSASNRTAKSIRCQAFIKPTGREGRIEIGTTFLFCLDKLYLWSGASNDINKVEFQIFWPWINRVQSDWLQLFILDWVQPKNAELPGSQTASYLQKHQEEFFCLQNKICVNSSWTQRLLISKPQSHHDTLSLQSWSVWKGEHVSRILEF